MNRFSINAPSFYSNNRKRFAKKLLPSSSAIFTSASVFPKSADQFFTYRQNSDFLYLTGINQEESLLLLHVDSKGELTERLFIIKQSENDKIWNGKKITDNEASAISGIEEVLWLESFPATLKEFVYNSDNIYLNLYENSRFEKNVETAEEVFARKIKNAFPLHTFKRAHPIIAELRMVKNQEEINMIEKACEITAEAFLHVLQAIKPGMKEYQVEAELTYIFGKKGVGHAYSPIVAAGGNACYLHYLQNNDECKNGDLLLMDFGADYAGYAADLSRTIPINGKFSKDQLKVYNAVLNVQKKLMPHYKPGATINEINRISKNYICEELLSLGYVSKNQVRTKATKAKQIAKYFMHGTAHFMGLDVHDAGSKEAKLIPGMVLSCEPAIYNLDKGIGIRLENDILITKSGAVNLMRNIPIEPELIEKLILRK